MQLTTYSELRRYITTNLAKIMEKEEASAESRRWLSEGLGLSLSWIIAHGESIVSNKDVQQIDAWLEERYKGKPWSYIIGWTSFLDRHYYVTTDTLIPRPETEMVLGFALDLGKKLKVQHACDIGTGSGVIAISLALETNWKITATDISRKALVVARKNAINLKATVNFRHGDLLTIVPNPVGLVVSNPPYIDPNDQKTLKKELMFEPKVALFADSNGLAIIKAILQQAFNRSAAGCVLEIGSGQGKVLRNHALAIGWHHVNIHKDLSNHDRVLVAW